MAKGYLIGHITVQDPEAYAEYVRLDTPILEKFGGRFLVRGGQSEAPETPVKDRHVVIEFPDYETAKRAYYSDEYQKVAAIRKASALSDIVIVEGHE